MTGRIADIQRFSLHDGPGIRTTVFLKGCPLRCRWCHNPECISFEKETLFYPERCIGCGQCENGCFSGASVLCGFDITEEELMEKIRADLPYFGSDGGVTFSGGEPLAQKDFLSAVLSLCRKEGIHTAIETSLFLYDEEIFKKADLVMADLKIWDSSLHRKWTGVDNHVIKENFEKLDRLGVPIIARTPIIPEISQEIPKISNFLKGLKSVQKYEFLPYHPLGLEKANALNKSRETFTIPTEEYMRKVNPYAFLR